MHRPRRLPGAGDVSETLPQVIAWVLVAAAALGAGVAVGVVAGILWVRRGRSRRPDADASDARVEDGASPRSDLDALTSGLAHEIKNPLSTIGLNAQLLAERGGDLEIPDDDRAGLTRRVEAVVREAERLRGILTDFLQYAGEPHLEPKPHDLNEVVDELVDFYLPQAERSRVRLRADPAPRPVIASVDIRQLKQAVLNLMLNATQAMAGLSGDAARRDAAGGDLILRTRVAADDEGRPIAEIHVIDTGPGITPEHRARLFEPYFTTRSGGTGLGLPTCRRLIEAHGGTIEVHSEPGTGSDFVIRLPGVSGDGPA